MAPAMLEPGGGVPHETGAGRRRATALLPTTALSILLSCVQDTERTLPPSRPPEPIRAELGNGSEAGGDRTLQALTHVEGLLELGYPDAALAVLDGLPPAIERHPGFHRVRAFALAKAGHLEDLRRLLERTTLSQLEASYLVGAALRQVQGGQALRALHELWWSEPDSIWGLSALRELVQIGGTGFTPAERDVVLARVRSPGPSAYLEDEGSAATVLRALAASTPPRGQLAREVAFAMGVQALRAERFTDAARHFEASLARTRDGALRRAIALQLGETRRRQGDFAAALFHFESVARGASDLLRTRALAAAGQMAIEQQRYPEAQRLLREQLLEDPVSGARQAALFGLGWVAYRTGAFREARQFFWTLLSEKPFGPLAPAGVYWGAQCLDALGDRQGARRELAALRARFPTGYYAYRAAERLGDGPAVEPVPLPRAEPRPDVRQLATYVRAGMQRRTRALVRRVLAHATELGPADLELVVELTSRVAPEAATRARTLYCERFGAGRAECKEREGRFLDPAVTRLADAAARERIPAEWLVGAAIVRSNLEPDRIGGRGEMGLLQLPRPILAGLWREEHHRRTPPTAAEVLREATSSLLEIRYAGRLYRAFGARREYALAALHAGPGAVTRWREARGELPPDIFVEEIPYTETRDFVRTALAGIETFRRATRPVAPPLAGLTPASP